MDKLKTILCIDDDETIRNLIGDYFTEQGYHILPARDGEEGLAVFREKEVDLVLVDLRMPKVDGFQVLDRISQDSPDTPVVVVSGEGEMADRFVKDPNEIVQVQQKIEVTVLAVDIERKRISLSMKSQATAKPAEKQSAKKKKAGPKPAPKKKHRPKEPFNNPFAVLLDKK